MRVHVCVLRVCMRQEHVATRMAPTRLNRDLQASGAAMVAPLLIQSFGSPLEPQNTLIGGRTKGEELQRERGAPWLCPCVPVGMRVPSPHCPAKRFKADALIPCVEGRLSGWQGRSAGTEPWSPYLGQAGQECYGEGGGRAAAPRCPMAGGWAMMGLKRRDRDWVWGQQDPSSRAWAPPACAEGSAQP